MIMRKNKFTMDFFSKIMEIICDDELLLTDDYNHNHEKHRHDQSLSSLLYKIMNGKLIINDETYFEEGFDSELAKKFPILATRCRN